MVSVWLAAPHPRRATAIVLHAGRRHVRRCGSSAKHATAPKSAWIAAACLAYFTERPAHPVKKSAASVANGVASDGEPYSRSAVGVPAVVRPTSGFWRLSADEAVSRRSFASTAGSGLDATEASAHMRPRRRARPAARPTVCSRRQCVGVSSLKEVDLSSGFSCFFRLISPLSGRTFCAEADGFFFERLRHDALGTGVSGRFKQLVGRLLKVCSSGPVAVVLFLATAPQVIPS
jgi:hypothetical protein